MDRNTSDQTRWVAAGMALMTASFLLVRTGRDALYFMQDSLAELPWAYLAIAMMSGPTAMLVIGVMRRIGSRRIRLVLPAVTSVVLLVYHPLAEPGAGPLQTVFFVFVPLVWGVMFSTAWLLGADLLEGRSPAVLALAYARIGAASIAGGILGGALARVVANLCTPADLLLFGACFLIAALGVLAAAQRRYPSPGRAPQDQPDPDVASSHPGRHGGIVLRNPYARTMLFLAILAGLVSVLIEYQFYYSAAALGASGSENVRFFSTVYTLLGAVAFVLQLWLMPRLQRRAGIEGSLLLLPAGLLLGAVSLLIGGGSVLARSTLRMAEGGLKSSVHRSNWEQAYLALPRRRRSTAKFVIDGVGSRFGEAAGALLLLAWIHRTVGDAPVQGHGLGWLSWVLVAGSLAWVGTTLALRTLRGLAEAPVHRPLAPVPLPDS